MFGQTFWKPIDVGGAAVHLSFIDHYDDFDITLDFAIRVEELEIIKHKDNINLKEKEKKETATIGVEYGNLTDKSQKRWTIESEEDINVVVDDIYDKVINVAIPYFDKFSDLENILSVCLKDDEEGMLHSPFRDSRAINAIGLARLLNRPDTKDIINKKIIYLKEFDEDELENFQKFLEKLDLQC